MYGTAGCWGLTIMGPQEVPEAPRWLLNSLRCHGKCVLGVGRAYGVVCVCVYVCVRVRKSLCMCVCVCMWMPMFMSEHFSVSMGLGGFEFVWVCMRGCAC